MNQIKKYAFVILMLTILTSIVFASKLNVGVALVKDRKTEIMIGEENYKTILENASLALQRVFIPNIMIEADSVVDGVLQFFDAVVFVSCSALDNSLKDPLETFVQNGGVLAVTYDTGLYNVEGEKLADYWLDDLLKISQPVIAKNPFTVNIPFDNNVSILSATVLVKPVNNALGLGSFSESPDYVPFVKTDHTLYSSLNLFTAKADKNTQVLEDFFIEELVSLINKDYAGLVYMAYEDLKPLASETRNLLRVSQREYRKTEKVKTPSSEISELYELSLLYSKAMQFAVEYRSSFHLPRYTMPANKVANELYEKASLVKIPYKTITTRGTYWANKVEVFASEQIPDNPIVFIGDSLTDRYQLKKYYPNKPVVNRGIGGDVASGLWDRKHLLGLEKKPTSVFVMVGTNNLLYNIQLFTYISDVEKFLLYIKEEVPETKIFVQSICPMAAKHNVLPKTIQNYNQDLKAMALKNGFTYVDIYSLFAGKDGYIKPELTIDGVHFTPLGYEIWTQKINELI